MDLKQAKELALEIDSKLLATDERFSRSVSIYHDEGTFMHYERAFVIKRENVYMIFTEHHGTLVYFEDDIEVIQHGPKLYISDQ
jgi:hypothetical protein